MNQRYESLMSVIHRVKRRWRWKMALRGLAMVSLTILALFLASVLLAMRFNFNPAALWTLRFLAVALLVWVTSIFLVLPLMRRVSDLQVARFIEEHHPGLEQRLTSAVELGPELDRLPSPFVLRRLIEDAFTRCYRLDLRQLIRGRVLAIYGLATLAGFIVLVAILSFGPAYFPYGAARLFAAWTRAADQPPFKVMLSPGNATVQRGSDQQIRATFEGFSPEKVILYWKEQKAGSWETMEMRPDAEGVAFGGLFANLSSSRDYYAEADGYKSSAYLLRVEDLPRITQIDLTYHFPAYTGLPAKRLENQGNISALKGTTVRLDAGTNAPGTQGRLQLNDGSLIPLKPGLGRVLTGELMLNNSGSYVIQLTDQKGEWHVASDEFPIEVLPDEVPEVVMSRPGRDYRASRIEEVYVEAKATDDMRVARLELRYSVNGKDEKSIGIFNQGKGAPLKSVSGGYTFFLEELPLNVGDVISYYAQASDGNPDTTAAKAASDMFFIEVSQFDKTYSQSQERGAPGGAGQGGESTGSLARQQKEIIAATWRLIRSRESMGKREFVEGIRSVAIIQTQLREKTAGLAATIGVRLASVGNTEMAKLGNMLKEASTEMERAEGQLAAPDLQKALPHEQAALKKLLEAESFYREVQVQFSSAADQASQAAMNWEDLSELFELEMDRIRNQYETLRQDAVKRRDETQDEALRRLRELAQRQEQFLERQRRLQAQQSSQGANAGGGNRQEEMQRQQELIEQAENLRRRLEQLSRDGQDQRMAEAARRLQQATEQMKQALQQMRSSQNSAAAVAGTQALQQLQEAERNLKNIQSGQSAKNVGQLQEMIRDLQADGRKIQEGVDRIASKKEEADPERNREERARINARKDIMASKLDNLETGLDSAAREAGSEQREAAKKLQEARSALRERRVRDKVLDGKGFIDKGWFDFAKAREDNIARDLKDLAEMLSQAQGQITNRPGERLQRALSQTRDLVDSLDSMKQRMAEATGQNREETQRPGNDSRDRQDGTQSRQAGDQSERDRAEARSGERQSGQPSGSGERQPRDGRPVDMTGGGSPVRGDRSDSNPRRLTPEEIRQLQREYAERVRQAQGIIPDLKEDRELAAEMEALLGRMRALNGQSLGAVSSEAMDRLFSEVLEPLKQFELALSRKLNEMSARNKLSRPSEDDVPPAYRKMVEEYLKKIAIK